MAKAKAGRTGVNVAFGCVELCGATGYAERELLEKWARDAKILDIFEGTQQIQLLVIARRLLDLSSTPAQVITGAGEPRPASASGRGDRSRAVAAARVVAGVVVGRPRPQHGPRWTLDPATDSLQFCAVLTRFRGRLVTWSAWPRIDELVLRVEDLLYPRGIRAFRPVRYRTSDDELWFMWEEEKFI